MFKKTALFWKDGFPNTHYNILPYHTLYYFYHSPHTTPLPHLGPEALCPLNSPIQTPPFWGREGWSSLHCREYTPREGQTQEKFEHAVFVVRNTSCGGPACFCQPVLWFYTCFTFTRCMLYSMIIQMFCRCLKYNASFPIKHIHQQICFRKA